MKILQKRNKNWRVTAWVIFPFLSIGITFQQKPVDENQFPVVRVETRLVLVDAVVTDKQGNPVQGLRKEDFKIEEDGKQQKVASFEWIGPVDNALPTGASPSLPENVYTNRPEYYRTPGPLTIVLLDLLNTSDVDLPWARRQLVKFVKEKLDPSQPVAVLALGQDLKVLQDFTTDHAALKRVFERAMISQMTVPQDGEVESFLEDAMAYMESGGGRSRAKEMMEREENFISRLEYIRMQKTFGALRKIATAVMNFPGRKNLIWVTGGVLSMYPGDNQNRHAWSNVTEMRKTAQMLNDARLAIYPVDPRGARIYYPPESSQQSERRRNPSSQRQSDAVTDIIKRFESSLVTMREVASVSGGVAFYNRNDLSEGVKRALKDGSSYYVLGYSPSNREWDGTFRRIKLKLARKGLKVRYRRGYYATRSVVTPKEITEGRDSRNQAELVRVLYESRAADKITFKALVSPPSAVEKAGQVNITFSVDSPTIEFRELDNGSRAFDLEFVASVFESDEQPPLIQIRHAKGTLTSAQYAAVRQSGLVLRMEVELPQGHYQLRLVVRDNLSQKHGRVDASLILEAPQIEAPP